jgi:hypothetical protein
MIREGGAGLTREQLSITTAKSKEEMLREEVRFYLDEMVKLMQWGVTLMVSMQTALFFLRRGMLESYIDAGFLRRGDNLPWGRYLIGTAFLFLAAVVVYELSKRGTEQYRHYKKQLVESSRSGIDDQATRGTSAWINLLYFAFPIFDIAIRLYVQITFSFR